MSSKNASAPNGLPAGADADAEYTLIESALLESVRGRWFLAEHSRRARRMESVRLDDALGKLQASLRQPPALLGQLKAELTRLRADIAASRTRVLSKPATPAEEPAPATILKSVEAMHQLAWNLQASPIDQSTCEKIAQQAAAIYAYSVGQAVQSKRASDLAASLDSAIAQIDGVLQTITLEADHEVPSGEVLAQTLQRG